VRAADYLEQNPEGVHALAGRLAFLRYEKRTLGRARRYMMESAYLAALELRNLGKRATHEDAAKAVTSYVKLLIPVLHGMLLPAMSASARLGSYGIERADLSHSNSGKHAIRSRHTRQLNRLAKGFASRRFDGRDLEDRCTAAAASYIAHMASEAAHAFTRSGSEGAGRAVEEYAAFGLRDKPRARGGENGLPDNPGWQVDLLVVSELNYAYNAGIAASGSIYDGYVGSQWTLSPEHDIVDICDDYATEDRHGLGPGVFPKGQEPAYPHPRCRCWLAPVFRKQEGR